MTSGRVRFGIDLGGTKTELIALSERGDVLLSRRVPTPAHDYDAIVETIARLVEDAEAELGCRGTLGIGMPGAISQKTQTVKNANTQCLNGRSFNKDVSAQLARPVRVHNDANCFALSEASDGAGHSGRVVFGVILGTGVGGGIVVDKRVLMGCNAVAGEWGHNPLPWARPEDAPTPACYCGQHGCIETYLSGPGMALDYARHTGLQHSAVQIALLAEQGDGAARQAIDRYCDRLARALASVINVLDPDVIVLGGGLSQIETLYTAVPARWLQYAFSDALQTQLVRAQHGDSSGVRGAAWLWPLP